VVGCPKGHSANLLRKHDDDPLRAADVAEVEVATLDPFHGYKNAIDDQLEDAVAVLDAFHVVKLGTDAVDASAAGSSRPPADTAAGR
jgi:transposase